MTKVDSVVCAEGLNALNEKLGLVDAERFIAILSRESFDYTEWRKELLINETVDSLFQKSKSYSESLERK